MSKSCFGIMSRLINGDEALVFDRVIPFKSEHTVETEEGVIVERVNLSITRLKSRA